MGMASPEVPGTKAASPSRAAGPWSVQLLGGGSSEDLDAGEPEDDSLCSRDDDSSPGQTLPQAWSCNLTAGPLSGSDTELDPDTEADEDPTPAPAASCADEERAQPEMLPAEPVSLDGVEGIILRCRWGDLLMVKVEEEEEEEAPPPPPEPAQPVGDLRQLFQQQRQREQRAAAADGEDAEGQDLLDAAAASARSAEDEALVRQQADELLATAQVLSYEMREQERRAIEEQELDKLQRGDTEPLEALDQDLMTHIYESIFEWLNETQHRCRLHRLLQLAKRSQQWYGSHAEAYICKMRQRLMEHLHTQGEDAAAAFSTVLDRELAKLEESVLSMPERGTFVPTIFVTVDNSGEQGAMVVD